MLGSHIGSGPWIASAIGLLLATHDVLAQSSLTPNAIAQAREQARIGLAAAHDEHWVEAREAFERAYALNPQPLARLNLASAQSRTGRFVDAAESYRAFLREAHAADERGYVDVARQSLADTERQIAHVALRIAGLHADDTLELDGRSLARASTGVALPIDPGPHALAVMREGRAIARTSFDLAPGSTRSVSLAVPPPANAVTLRVGLTAPVRSSSTRWHRAPVWPWVVLGVGLAAVAGGAITTAVLLSGPADGSPHGTTITGNFPGGCCAVVP